MKKALLYIVLCCSCTTLVAQKPDSLYNIWLDESQTDSIRVNALNKHIVNHIVYPEPDSAFKLAEVLLDYCEEMNLLWGQAKALSLMGLSKSVKSNYPDALIYYGRALKTAEETGSKSLLASMLINTGGVYSYSGDYPKTLKYYGRALEIYEELNNKRQIAIILYNTGFVYHGQGAYPMALKMLIRSLKISEETDNKDIMAVCLNFIGGIYMEQNNYPKALEYLELSLELSKERKDKNNIATCLNNIGSVYSSQGDYEKALQHFHHALNINEEIGDKRNIALTLNNLASVHKEMEHYSEALEEYNKALLITEEIGEKKGITRNLNDIGFILNYQKNFSNALEYCMRALAIAEEIGALENQKQSCQCIYDAYKALGEGNDALKYLEKMNILVDSLNAEETATKLQQMEFAKTMLQDSIAKADEARVLLEAHQEEVRQKNRTRNMLAGGGLLILFLAGGLYARVRYIRRSKAVLQVEKDRSENLLLNILPADIAAELKEKGRADARDFDMVSILFTDFKGFTAASEKLSAQELVAEINTCFEAFDGIMGKYNIEKIKTIGDAYMAAGGLPIPADDSVKNTVLAALEMQAFVGERKAEMDAKGLSAFEMRVGIHTGPVVAGIVGVKKFAYDIWGDTVNTASRMESSGGVGQVNISEVTYELLKKDTQFSFESRGKIEAKGKGEMEMYFVSKN